MVINGKKVKKLFERGVTMELLYESKRVLPLLIIAILLLIPDTADLMVAMFSIGVVLLAAAIAQAVRRIIVPYLNLEHLVKKVEDNPIACSIVIVGTFWMFVQILQTIAVMFK